MKRDGGVWENGARVKTARLHQMFTGRKTHFRNHSCGQPQSWTTKWYHMTSKYELTSPRRHKKSHKNRVNLVYTIDTTSILDAFTRRTLTLNTRESLSEMNQKGCDALKKLGTYSFWASVIIFGLGLGLHFINLKFNHTIILDCIKAMVELHCVCVILSTECSS